MKKMLNNSRNFALLTPKTASIRLMVLFLMLCSGIFMQSWAQTPTITSFTPSSGNPGTLVTITGTNLGSPTAFTIGGATAIVVSNTGTSLVGMVMPGSSTGTISISTSGGNATSLGTFSVMATSYPSVQQDSKLVAGAIGAPSQGWSVAISANGNTAIVGVPYDNNLRGAVFIYTRSGGTWSQLVTKLVAGAIGEIYQGWSVAISADGNTVMFGGWGDYSGIGSAWVFTRSGGTWSQQGISLNGIDCVGKSNQGKSVALSADGNTAIIGGPNDNGGIGAAWVFTRSNGTWSQQGNKLVGSYAVGSANQGFSVSLSADGNTAIIGGPSDNNLEGATWLFTRSGGTWFQQGNKISGSGAVGASKQGISVSLSADGNTAIIGGPFDNYLKGAAWVYTRNGGIWSQQGNKITGSDTVGTSQQGNSVSLSADGNTAIVGGSGDNGGIGATWVYTRDGGTWSQQGNKKTGSGAVGTSNQGKSVALSADGNTAIVGGSGDNGSIGAAWVYTVPPAITTGFVSTTLCAAATVVVPYTIVGTFTAGNVFTAQLSDNTGSFTNPVAIGTLTSTASGTITATIPSATMQGLGYRIRVVSSAPVIIGSPNTNDIVVQSLLDANAWKQKTSLSAEVFDLFPTLFSIGNKGYLSTSNTIWEYDPNETTWTQKSNIPGAVRDDALGFSIGSKGYLGLGSSGSSYPTDFYEFDPLSNMWMQKANFPGAGRLSGSAIAFSIGTKGYIGSGVGSGNAYYNDFYEFNPSSNTWTQKANCPGSLRSSPSGFSIGTKGYFGGGILQDGTTIMSDFHEYNPSTNLWTAKANLPGSLRWGQLAFSIGNKGYYGFGYYADFVTDFYEYDPAVNTWTAKNAGGLTSWYAWSGFAIGNRGYFGLGFKRNTTNPQNASASNHIWEYSPTNTTIYTGNVGNAFCKGSSVSVPFTIGCNAFTAGNVFTAQLSDSMGTFASPVSIGTLTATTAGTITATIPANATSSSKYKIRVVGSNPVTIGYDNGSDINTIDQIAGAIATTGETICSGQTPAVTIGNITAAVGGNFTYSWRSSADNYTAAIPGATGATYLPPAGLTTTTSFRRYDQINCSTPPIVVVATGIWTVTVNPLPATPTIIADGSTTLCNGGSVVLNAASNALDFDGTDDFVNVPTRISPFTGNEDHTIEFNVLYKGGQTGDRWLLWYGTAGVGNNLEVIGYDGATGKIKIHHLSAGNDITATTAALTPNVWTHVALVYNGSFGTTTIYINGVLVETFTYSDDLAIPAISQIQLGTYASYAACKMTLDEVRIWNAKRTQSQIQAYMNTELVGTESNLKLYYNFNQGTQFGSNIGLSTLIDRTTNAYTGTLINFALTGATSNFIRGCGCTNSNSYLWSNGATTQSITVTNSGSYTLQITNANGCQSAASAATVVTVNPLPATPTITAVGSTNISSCGFVVLNAASSLGNALDFDGSNDYVNVSTISPFTGNEDHTIEFNVLYKGGQIGDRWLLWYGNEGVANNLEVIGYDGATGKIKIHHVSAGNDITATTAALTPNDWTHVALVYTGSNRTTAIYINGVYTETFTYSANLAIPTNSQIQLGTYASYADGVNFSCNMTLDEVRIWNATRTQSQIQASMNTELVGTESNLKLYYNFNQGTAGGNNVGLSTVIDRTTNGYTGTLNNFNLIGATSNWVKGPSNSYLWSNGATTQSITATTSGNYTVQVTNANGCQSAASAATVVTGTAPAPTVPTITAGGSTTLCIGGSVVLTANAGSSYLWNNGATAQAITVTTAGSYTVQVTNGCQSLASAATVVTVNPLPATPTIIAYGSTTFCNGGSVLLNAASNANALDFDGADDFVNVPTRISPFTGNEDHTIEFNVLYKGGQTDDRWLAWYGTEGVPNALEVIGYDGATGNLKIHHISAGNDKTATNAALTPNVWTHVALVYTGSNRTTTIYINGVLVETFTYSEDLAIPANSQIQLGAYAAYATYGVNFACKMTLDEVRIWNATRTQSQIQASMNTELVGTESNLKLYYNFNQGTAGGNNFGLSTVIDKTTNAYTGTLINFALTGATSNFIRSSTDSNSYLWSNGATTQSITVTNSGSYTVKEISVYGCQSAVSAATVVTVNAPTVPTITAGGSTTFCNGGSVVLNPPSSSSGNALDFDGSNDYVNVPTQISPFTGNADHTIEFNVLYKGGQVGDRYLLFYGIENVANNFEVIGYDGATGKIMIFHSNFITATTAALNPNVWTHVALVYTGSDRTTAIYINGTYVETFNFTMNLDIPATSKIQLGAYADDRGRVSGSCNMTLDEVRIWNATRTQSEIQAFMNNELVGTESNLKLYYNFNQGTAGATNSADTTLSDQTVSGYTGTLKNFNLIGATSNWVNGPSNSYLWSNGATTQSITATTSGNYTVQVTNANGCQSAPSAATVVTVNSLPATPTITVGGATTFCSGGSVVLTASAGSSYLWSNGSTTQAITVTTSGSYTVQVTNANGCQSAASVATVVTVNALPTVPISGNTSFCTGGNTVLSSNATAGSGTISSYQWKIGGVNVASAGTSATYTATAAGSYTVTVTNSNGCSFTSAAYVVSVNALPTAPTNLACYETATFNNSSCVWDITGTQPTMPTLACYQTASFNTSTCAWVVTGSQPSMPTLACYETATFDTTTCDWYVTGEPVLADAGSDASICSNESYYHLYDQYATGSGGIVSWSSSGDGGFQFLGDGYTSLQPLYYPGPNDKLNGSATLTLTVTGANGCLAISSFNLTINPTPVAIIDPSNSGILHVCAGGSYSFSNAVVQGSDDISWFSSGDGSFNSNNIQNPIYTPGPQDIIDGYVYISLYVDTYSGNAGGGCSDVDDILIIIDPAPVLPTLACYETASFNASTCAWVVTGSQPSMPTLDCYETASFNTSTCSWVVTGSQPLMPTLACYETATFDTTLCVWVVTGEPVLAYAGSDASICSNQIFYFLGYQNATGSGGIVSWSSSGDGIFFLVNGFTSLEPHYNPGPNDKLNGSATLTLTVTGANGCLATSSFNLTLNPAPVAIIDSSTIGDLHVCVGGSYSFSNAVVQGADLISWNSNGDGSFDNPGIQNPVYTPGPQDIFDGYVHIWLEVDSRNASAYCDNYDDINLIIDPAPSLPTLACYETASFNASTCSWVVSGTAPAAIVTTTSSCNTYTWTANGNSYTQSGTYSYNANCQDYILNLTINVSTSSSTSEFICATQAPYLWNGGSYNTSGTYSYSTTNAAGCDSLATLVLIVGASIPNPVATVTQPTCATSTGTINVSSPIGAGLTYSIGGAYQSSTSFSGVQAGLYNLSVQNGAGCSSAQTTPVIVNLQPIVPGVTTVTGQVNVCNVVGTNNTLSYTASALGAATYTWSLPANTVLVSGQGTATISVQFLSGFTAQANKQLRVVASSICGSNAQKLFYLSAQYPTTPSIIVASTANVCPSIGTNVPITYKVPKVPGAASYIWNAQSGTTTISHPNGLGENDTLITMTFASNFTSSSITVQTTNDCGTSAIRSILVSRANPTAPGLVSGPSKICEYSGPTGIDAVYFLNALSTVNTYTWTLPSDATNVSGQGTSSISFRYPAGYAGGSISVTATNGCGTSAARTFNVSRLLPATPGSIDVINTSLCPNREFTYSIAAMPSNTTSLEWTVPTGGQIVSGQGTRSITVSYSSGVIDGKVSVRGISNCGTSTYKHSTVKLAPCASSPSTLFTKANTDNAPSSFEVKVFPNPTTTNFNVQVITAASKEINIRVLDVQGRFIKSIIIAPYQTAAFGSELNAGVYMLEVKQGEVVKKVRVVKY